VSKPRDVFKSSDKKYWFVCDMEGCKHEFESSLNNITTGTWCPYCASQKLCDDKECKQCLGKSFASNVERSNCWHPIKNVAKPRDIFKLCNNKYWFVCDKDGCKHEFESRLNDISRKQWCPYCASKKLCDDKDCKQCFEKSFASNVERSNCWHPTKNTSKPRDVFKSSDDKYWFVCDKDGCKHEFESSLSDITRGTWCPYHSEPPKLLCNDKHCKQCLMKSFASNVERSNCWHSSNVTMPRHVFKYSDDKYWFVCNNNGCKHEFESSLNNITNGTWCPYHSEPPKLLCDDKDCKQCFEKSFASNLERSNCWHPTKNISKPRDVFKCSNDKYWFVCKKDGCKHEFESSLSDITRGTWCPYHSKPPKLLCDDEDCKQCLMKSFASNVERSNCWHPTKNVAKPRDIFKSSGDKYWFICDNQGCKHEFESTLSNITGKHWCPYCSEPPKLLCDDEDCKQCLGKSFASNVERAKCWSLAKNKSKPRDIFKSSGDKYWFVCEKNHEFESSLHNITNGNWCPICINKTETILLEWLKLNYPQYNITYQLKVDWCKNICTNNYLPFDFFITDLDLIIELDGPQHFEQISNWQSPDDTLKRDIYKQDQALLNNISVVRVLQSDIFYNTNDWISYLQRSIKKYDIPTIITPLHTTCYDNHNPNLITITFN
jgi:hypothetical protein